MIRNSQNSGNGYTLGKSVIEIAIAREMNEIQPTSSPYFSAFVLIPATSEPATGSVTQYAY